MPDTCYRNSGYEICNMESPCPSDTAIACPGSDPLSVYQTPQAHRIRFLPLYQASQQIAYYTIPRLPPADRISLLGARRLLYGERFFPLGLAC